MEHQRTLEGPRPESPAQVSPGQCLLLPESCDLILLGLLTGFFPTDCSWWLLLPRREAFRGRRDRGAGPSGRTDKEEGKFTFSGQVPSLQNKQDGGRGCWRGCRGPLDPETSQTAPGSPSANQSLAVSLGRPGSGPAHCFWKSDGLWALSAAPSLCSGERPCLDGVCAVGGRNLRPAEAFSSLTL